MSQVPCTCDVSCNSNLNPVVGVTAPTFTADAVKNGELIQFNSKMPGKYLILLFYPLDFTFVCPTELTSFNDALSEFEALNATVVGISVDSKFSHLQWTQQSRKDGGLGPNFKMTLVSDLTKNISRAYGVLSSEGFSHRGLFVIDDHGVIRHVTVNDSGVGRNVDETLRIVKAFQYHDKHGEVCPAGWQPGSKGMVPSPKESKEFFKSA